jgi:hypothetical protein
VNPLRYHHHAAAHRAEAFYMLRRYDEAAEVLAALYPIPARRRLWFAATLAMAGRESEAPEHLAAFAAEMPGQDPVEVARHTYNYERSDDTGHFLDGLRRAIAAG